MAAIKAYGGQCMKCGYADWRALQFDHVHGGGRGDRARYERSPYFKKLIREVRSGIYQLLCANCNQIKRYDDGEGYVR